MGNDALSCRTGRYLCSSKSVAIRETKERNENHREDIRRAWGQEAIMVSSQEEPNQIHALQLCWRTRGEAVTGNMEKDNGGGDEGGREGEAR